MGDIGHVDEDGWLYFDYRKGGGVRRNGDFINTATVEKVLSQIESIDDVFVYGVPFPGMAPGEKELVAAIVIADGASFDRENIFRVCSVELESNYIPSFLQVVNAIPKTASEKPQERFLLEAFDTAAGNIYSAASLEEAG